MNQKEVNKQIFTRLERLEREILERQATTKKPNKAKKSLPDLLLELRDQKFFTKPKSIKEVHDKVATAYACDLDRVSTALRRLKGRKQLRISAKVEDGQKVIAYVW